MSCYTDRELAEIRLKQLQDLEQQLAETRRDGLLYCSADGELRPLSPGTHCRDCERERATLEGHYWQDEGIAPDGELRPLVSKLLKRVETAEQSLFEAREELRRIAGGLKSVAGMCVDEKPYPEIWQKIMDYANDLVEVGNSEELRRWKK
jgi:hypothetical protein